jgi:hypothetical protein
MWNSTLMKTIRWITFIPICLILIKVLLGLLVLIVSGIISLNLSILQLVIGLLLLGVISVALFSAMTTWMTALTIKFCPNRKAGGIILIILTLLSFTYSIIKLWVIQNELKDGLVGCIIMTILFIGLCINIIFISNMSTKEP